MSVLEIKNLSHRFEERPLFENANLSISAGEHVGIVGLNGAGKSTFINILAGNITHDEGEVLWLNGLRRGYLDQHANIDRSLTVMEYLTDAFDYLHKKNEQLTKMYEDMCYAEGAELDR
ncbi:MAG: ABC-F family ATP-binding cassette domain-containing protein, partial [Clostridia bacterium]|nr:ABC-F family ATP-binding cassette domain-containing protein [Clostridia bacterium]